MPESAINEIVGQPQANEFIGSLTADIASANEKLDADKVAKENICKNGDCTEKHLKTY